MNQIYNLNICKLIGFGELGFITIKQRDNEAKKDKKILSKENFIFSINGFIHWL